MISYLRAIRPAGVLAVAVSISAISGTGCGNGNKTEAPAQFSANPTDQPIDGGKGGKTGGKKERGPADKAGDG